jgi:polyphenol oxidase
VGGEGRAMPYQDRLSEQRVVAPWRWRRRVGLVLLEARLGPAALAFTSREGGVSAEPFQSLNLGGSVGDREESVAENRRRLLSALGLAEGQVRSVHQVHGARVLEATAQALAPASEADGLVTTVPGLALLLRFADCVPVFLAAAGRRPGVALAHAGWRGLAAGVVEAAVARLGRETGSEAQAMLAAIGPAIGPSYQVDEPVMAQLRARYGGVDRLRGQDGVLDMTGAVREALLGAGLLTSSILETSERTESPAFFSHRASGGRTGRMAGVVRLGGGWP